MATSLSAEEREILEGTSPQYTATLKDEATNLPVPLADITSLTLTLYDLESLNIINLRDEQNILNANNVTVHATSGLLTWQTQPEDNVIVDTTLDTHAKEVHIALFEWELTNGRVGRKEVQLDIVQLDKVP